MAKLIHTIAVNISGYTPNYTKVIELPVNAKMLLGVSAFSPQTGNDAHNLEIELVLNDDRNNVIVPVQPSGSAGENRSGIVTEGVNVELVRDAEHIIILRNIAITTLTLLLETCDE